MTAKTVVLVEDEAPQRDMLTAFLEARGYRVLGAATAEEGVAAVTSARPDALLTDFNLPDGDGIQVLREARALDPEMGAIVLSAYGTVKMAVDAMRSGAFDVLLKPVEPDVLLGVLQRAIEHRALRRENATLRRAVGDREAVASMIGRSPVMAALFDLVRRVARSDAPVLLTGESGTGKELVARLLHADGGSELEPFVAINCAALPAGLIESELFGHVKGAFTGAIRDHAGCFEEAGHGTLFLDEIGELPLPLQGRLLRELQQREVVRVGESTPRKIHARVLTATHRDLEAETRTGTFRADLYHRIHVLRVDLPPLRVRGGDIEELAAHFLEKVCERNGLPPTTLTREALEALRQYPFPGNVRELRNIIEQAAILAEDGRVRARDLPAQVLAPAEGDAPSDDRPTLDLTAATEALERRLIRVALHRSEGVQTQAARLLGIDERVLRYKRKKLGLARDGTTS